MGDAGVELKSDQEGDPRDMVWVAETPSHLSS